MLVSFAMVIGTLTVTAMAQEYPVYIGDTGYDTIQDAVAALSSDGQTIRVSEAFTDTGSSQALTGTNYSFTVDLGGKTFTGARAFAPTGVTVTLKNGTITSTNNTAGCAVRATSGAVVTLGEGLLITGCSSSNSYGCVQGSASTITVDGAVLENSLNTSNNARTIYLGSNSTLNIVSGTVEITAYAYQGTINVSGGFVGANMLTNGSSGNIVVTGGYFGANPSGHYSSAYEWVEDNTYEGYAGYIREKSVVTNVVEITDTGVQYAAIENAIAALSADGQTIKLLNTFDTATDITIASAPYAFTFDLGGFELTGEANGSSSAISVTGSTVTIVNGTINVNKGNANRAGVSPGANAKVTLGSGLTINGTSAKSNGYGITGTGAATAELTVDGAVINGVDSQSRSIYVANGGKLNINSGYINGDIYTYNGTTTITDGYFLGSVTRGGSGNVTASGGYYGNDSVAAMVAAGYELADNDTDSAEDYPYCIKVEVIEGTPTATVCVNGGEAVDYKSIDAALADAVSAGAATVVITLNEDATASGGTSSSQYIFGSGADITLNLGGNTLTRDNATGVRLFRLNDGAKMTVTGGTVQGNGTAYIAANGAFAYVNDGSTLTLNGTTISGFMAGTNASGTQRSSGAIHVVNNGSVLNMISSVITGCSADDKGGAVTVASTCTLNMDASSRITDCTAKYGGAVYIDSNADTHASGTANINGTIENCASTGESSAAPVYSNGFAFINEVLTTSGIVYQARSAAKIFSAGLVLESDFTFNITALAALAEEDASAAPKLAAVFEGTKSLIEGTALGGGYYKYTYPGITANKLADQISFSVTLSGDTDISATKDYSVVEYCNDLYAADPDNSVQNTLLANTLKYGSEVQKYWGEGTAFEVPENIAAYILNDKPTAAQNAKKTSLAPVDSSNYKIKAASLNVNDKVRIFFNIFSTDQNATVSVTKNGSQVGTFVVSELITTSESSVYRLELDRITALEYDNVFSVTLYNSDGQAMHAVEYSVNSYCYAKQNSISVGDIALAIYRYGVAAEAYAAA